MKQDIKKLSKYIHDELNMAESYLNCAAAKTGDERDLFKVISRDELDSSVNPLAANDQNKIIWEYVKEGFKDRHIKLKANWTMLD